MFKKLEKQIGVTVVNVELLKQAFIHRSYLNEHRTTSLSSNEKLEFLGDSVLSLATSMYLYRNFPELNEGIYTDIKAAVVRTESLAEAAKSLDLGSYLFLSKGEKLNGGRENKNILADSFESLIAALFLDKGFDITFSFILKWLFKDKIDFIVKNRLYLSPKSRLQELIQAVYKALPQYTITSETGPEHKKHFEMTVSYDGKLLGKGSGASKKEAEEQAAKNALEFMKKKGIIT